jgi:hypothetical protein
MRTTIRLEDGLLDQARLEARRRGKTLTALIEESLRLELARTKTNGTRARVVLPVGDRDGGPRPGVNLDNSAELLAILEEGVPLEKRR